VSIKRKITRARARMYTTAKRLGDVQAVLKGRIVERAAQRVAGKIARKQLNKIEKVLK
jgi:hypothetical protein